MKDFTLGTLISCLFLAFMLGFLACHKLYTGLDRRWHDNHDFTRRNNPSLPWE